MLGTKSISRVIKTLVISDFFLNCGWGLLGPLFGIFILEKIAGGDTMEAVKVAGFASLIYWVVKSFLQIPIGHYLDKNHGETDDFLFMVIGTLLAGIVPFGYLFASSALEIYLWQVIYAIAMSMVIPPWMAVFTRHIDKGKEAFEWGLESTSIGLGAGIAGAVGGILASFFGFNIIFILVGVFTIFSGLLMTLIRNKIYPKTRTQVSAPFAPFPF